MFNDVNGLRNKMSLLYVLNTTDCKNYSGNDDKSTYLLKYVDTKYCGAGTDIYDYDDKWDAN